jgi:crotonobetainyl-CoA:carnitine CoA-transferase CaiB-like acyl-CoA transferase
MSNGPLSHIKVLDLTQARAGPTAVRQLADMGADVVQVARPRGSDILGGSGNSDYENLHRNKRSMIIDLQRPEGREVFYRLVPQFDVVVENFRPDVKRRLKVDYETLSAINPRIIYGSNSGFGQDGPYGHRPGVDQIAQGMGGLMSITGPPGSGPWRVGIAITDTCAGMFLAQGILVALLEREQSGRGQWVHTSLLETMIAMLDFQATRWLIDGVVPQQAGNDHPSGATTGLFATKDGQINVAATGDHMWTRLIEAIDGQDIADDPRFVDNQQRRAHKAEVHAAIEEKLKARTSAEWIELLNEAGLPCGPVLSIDQTFADPQVQHLHMAREVHHPIHGDLNIVRSPVNLARTPASVRTAAPVPGADTEAILAEHGFATAEIASLIESGVVGQSAQQGSAAREPSPA